MNNPALNIRNLTVSYGNNVALSNISFSVDDGDFLGIIGPNGGGKSTLLKAILNLVPACSGEVFVYGQKNGSHDVKIGYVPQFALMDKQFPITVIEVVLTGRLPKKPTPFHKYSEQDIYVAEKVLNNVGIPHLAQRKISDLSGGEFQKVLIARALAQKPKILLLDEPTASVDTASRRQIFSLLDKLNSKMTIIFVTHDLLAVSSHVKSLACLNNTLVFHGEPELTDSVVQRLYDCPVDLIAHGVPHRVLGKH